VFVVSIAGTGFAYSSATAASKNPTCNLRTLGASVGLQGATGSMLGGLSVRNPGATCTLAGRPVVEFRWHGKRVTPPQTPFDPRSLRSLGAIHSSRTLVHGRSLFVWVQWWNYCGAKPWGGGGFRPVAVLRVGKQPGSLTVRFRELVVPPFCNSPRDARFSVSDFGVSP
jgi:hypothetical protein